MLYDVYHWTEYRYADQVPLSTHRLRMSPRELPHQQLLEHRIRITPEPVSLTERTDYFGNQVVAFSITAPHTALQIRVESQLQRDHARLAELPRTSPAWETVRADTFGGRGGAAVQDFVYPSAYTPHLEPLRDWAAESFQPKRPLLEVVKELTHRIHERGIFDNAATSVSTPVLEVFENRRGVCQDFAHLQIVCLRAFGIPARYVSGYLRTEPPLGRQRVFGADASHAWVSVWLPGNGWIDFDPTNDCPAGAGYVTLGWGRDYGDVSLIRGNLTGGGEHQLFLSVNVEMREETAA